MILRCAQRGFTLIELLAVLMIIGLLAVIGVPKYLATTERARAGEAVSILKAAHDSAQRYCLKYGELPTSPDDLDIDFVRPKYFELTLEGIIYEGCSKYSLRLARTEAEYVKFSGFGDTRYILTFEYDTEKSPHPRITTYDPHLDKKLGL
ncbi:type II secretion system protein [Elusimicrobiota bacterium]